MKPALLTSASPSWPNCLNLKCRLSHECFLCDLRVLRGEKNHAQFQTYD